MWERIRKFKNLGESRECKDLQFQEESDILLVFEQDQRIFLHVFVGIAGIKKVTSSFLNQTHILRMRPATHVLVYLGIEWVCFGNEHDWSELHFIFVRKV